MRALFVRPQKSTVKPWLWVLATAALTAGLVGAWRPAGLGDLIDHWDTQMNAWLSPAPQALEAPAPAPEAAAENPPVEPPATAAIADLSPDSALMKDAAAANADKPAATPTPPERVAEAPSIELQVASFVEQWASSWSSKNTEAYLGCYDKSFAPEGGKRLADWRQEREQRITSKKQITVAIKDLVVLPTSPSGWRANFVQVYEADGFKSTSAKTLLLSRSDGHWKITREFTP